MRFFVSDGVREHGKTGQCCRDCRCFVCRLKIQNLIDYSISCNGGIALYKNGAVRIWGLNPCNVYEGKYQLSGWPRKIKDYQNIVAITSFNGGCCFLNNEGEVFYCNHVFKWGKYSIKKLVFTEKIVKIFGYCQLWAIGESGQIYGSYQDQIIKFQQFSHKKVIQIASMDSDIFFLMEVGTIYKVNNIEFDRFDFKFGEASNKLNLSNKLNSSKVSLEYEDENDKIIKIDGKYHLLALSENGNVYGFGSNKYGELCLGYSSDPFDHFIKLPDFAKDKIVDCSAGVCASFFVDSKGYLWKCGKDVNIPSSDKCNLIPERDERFNHVVSVKADWSCFFAEVNSDYFINKIALEKDKLQQELKSLKAKISNENPIENMKKCNDTEIINQKKMSEMKIIEKVGKGSSAKVYKVLTEKVYALKVFYIDKNNFLTYEEDEKDDSEEENNEIEDKEQKEKSEFHYLRKFISEYEILSQLKHRNIIETYGICYGDETHPPSILLEYCPTNLKTIISTLSTQEKTRIIFEIVEGMEFIHYQGIIHRDLKPENILLSEGTKTVKISDFGISTLIENSTNLTTSTTFTTTYNNFGTLIFMSPEQLNYSNSSNFHVNQNEKIKDSKFRLNEKVDVYSFGVLLFYILTNGKYPNLSIGDKIRGQIPKFPRNLNSSTRSLLEKCFSFSPSDRPSF
ncbi:hypothetical protein TRFO_31534 [Tritrichomonas foetus]|uniref:Protein kinase domain-containing protein n=1 Tax=Tritrichomonas foetus TaxID=1144522 RepID=A0A1J4JQU9_9EUKA|nr:hypothetical protein TRFO_31534 [Tritrichomonas foetus]|eukprot:OHT01559.1 hypothetical protein TRFO_31534 [Tritrichomonas foetus]